MKSEELAELCTADAASLRRTLSHSKKTDKSLVAIVPDMQTLKWHHAREDFVANELYGKVPEAKGAMVSTMSGHRVWCYWTRVWTNPQEDAPNTLHILRLVIEDDEAADFQPASEQEATNIEPSEVMRAVAALLAAAQVEASKWDMKEVEIWNPASTTLAAARLVDPNCVVTHREKESITSLQWYGEHADQPVEYVQWVCNEKYAWC